MQAVLQIWLDNRLPGTLEEKYKKKKKSVTNYRPLRK